MATFGTVDVAVQDGSLDVLALMGAPPVWLCPAWLQPLHADAAQPADSHTATAPAEQADASSSTSAESSSDGDADAHGLSATADPVAAPVPDEDTELSGYLSTSESASDTAAPNGKSTSAQPGGAARHASELAGTNDRPTEGKLAAQSGGTRSKDMQAGMSSTSAPGLGTQRSSSDTDDSSTAESSSSDQSSSDDAGSGMNGRPVTGSLLGPASDRQTREGTFLALDQVFADGRASAPNSLLRLNALDVSQSRACAAELKIPLQK